MGVAFLVSPYESDAQLAYLCRQGIVQAIITEDSDLIPYGAKRVWGGVVFSAAVLVVWSAFPNVPAGLTV